MKTAILSVLFLFVSFLSFTQEKGDTCIARIDKIASLEKRALEYDYATVRCWESGEYELAIVYANRGLSICEDNDFPKVKAALLNDRGIACDYLGRNSLALKSFFEALRIQEKLNHPSYEAYILGNIGLIYDNQNLLKKALEYHNKSLVIRRRIKDEKGIGASINNIANIYHQWKQYDKAIASYKECIAIDLKYKDTIALGDDYNNIGNSYMGLEQFDTALDYYNQSLAIRSKMNAPYLVAQTVSNIGTLYFNKKEYIKARPYLLRGLEIADSISGKDLQVSLLDLLYQLEEDVGDFEKAHYYFKLFTKAKESTDQAEDFVRQTEMELNYEFDKQKEKDKLIREKKEAQDRLILYAVSAVLLVIVFFSMLLFRRWKQTQLQKSIIEEKNSLVQQKNDEITDSITYAKRIQTAILPSEQLLNELIPSQFVLYLPKDIVAGDFYWLEQVNEKIFFAVADCTGHGVPGAMMSVVCHNALNRSVREFGLTTPGSILDKTREIIVSELSKNGDSVSDGMDISLCVLDSNAQTISWSGANNPLWIYRSESGQIEEWKADKQPIGMYSAFVPFTSHTIDVKKNDHIYLFTDGFADQFGGEKGKKLMKRAFQDTLLQSSTLSPIEQKKALENFYFDWKGDLDQVDDVCVSGIVV